MDKSHNKDLLTDFLLLAGYIDLSKRRVGPEDIAKCTEKYSNAKHVSRVICFVYNVWAAYKALWKILSS